MEQEKVFYWELVRTRGVWPRRHGTGLGAPVHKHQAEWTILIFMNADNSLDGSALLNFKAMAKVGGNSRVNIVVQLDSKKSMKRRPMSYGKPLNAS